MLPQLSSFESMRSLDENVVQHTHQIRPNGSFLFCFLQISRRCRYMQVAQVMMNMPQRVAPVPGCSSNRMMIGRKKKRITRSPVITSSQALCWKCHIPLGRAENTRTATQTGTSVRTANRFNHFPFPKTVLSRFWFPIMLRITYMMR
jgi:hypothetical protein